MVPGPRKKRTPKCEHYNKLNYPVIYSITFYLEVDDRGTVDFGTESITSKVLFIIFYSNIYF